MLRAVFFVLTLIIGQTSALADPLFSSEVVLDNKNSDREKVAKENAFINVLVRASGQSDISENPAIKKALPNVAQYLTRIGYGTVRGKSSLIARFDDNKIRNLLTTAKAYYWGVPRPEVLFWIVDDSLSDRNLVWDQSESPLIKDLKEQGIRRGLPVLIPIGDFDDIISVSIPDLWGGFVEPIAQASIRYKPTGVVVVKVRNHQITWQFFPNAANMEVDFPIEGAADGSKIEMFSQMIDEISNYYVENFAINLGIIDENAKILEVSGLDTAEDFFALERALKALNTVTALRLDFVRNGTAVFNINLVTAEKMFHNELENDRRFRLIGTDSLGLIDMPDQPEIIDMDTVKELIIPGQPNFIEIDSFTGMVVVHPEDIKEENAGLVELDGIALFSDVAPDIRYQWMD